MQLDWKIRGKKIYKIKTPEVTEYWNHFALLCCLAPYAVCQDHSQHRLSGSRRTGVSEAKTSSRPIARGGAIGLRPRPCWYSELLTGPGPLGMTWLNDARRRWRANLHSPPLPVTLRRSVRRASQGVCRGERESGRGSRVMDSLR